MRTSSLTFHAVGAAVLLAFAAARGEEKETPAPKRPWVGIATAPIDYALRDHLEIAEGFGIQVIEVLPDSPAAVAGLRNNDIITRFEDQHLISPEHLSLLVRTKKSGEKVAFSIIRKGKEEAVELTLGETDEERFPMQPGFGPGQSFPGQQENLRRQQDYWQDWMNKNHPEWRGNPSRRDGGNDGDQVPPPQPVPGRDLPRENRPPSISVNPGFPLRVFGSEGVLKIDNEQGELTLTRKDKDHTLQLKNAEGKVIYDGPFDPETGVEALPQEARDQLKTMKLGNFEIRLPEGQMKDPEKTTVPPVEKPSGPAPEGGIL
jgi:serine protease Do